MKWPRVELSFDVETTDCYITVWISTDNLLRAGDVALPFKERAELVRSNLVKQTHASKETLTMFLENHPAVTRFRISMRDDYKNFAIWFDRYE